MSLISIHVPNKQTGNSFFKETNKHIDPNKTYRLGKKAKKNKRTGTSIWDTSTLSYEMVLSILTPF